MKIIYDTDKHSGAVAEGSGAVGKSIYTKSGFLDLIPAAIRQEIAAENKAGTPEIMDWIFIVNAMADVNLNPGQHPQGFVDGLNSMAANVNISLNQTQIDNFLEV